MQKRKFAILLIKIQRKNSLSGKCVLLDYLQNQRFYNIKLFDNIILKL